jgi:hypothetical protein
MNNMDIGQSLVETGNKEWFEISEKGDQILRI